MVVSSSFLYSNYSRAPVRFVSGFGSRLRSESGDEYIDFAAGIAVMSLGHCHPSMVSAMREQSERLWHVSNLFEVPEQERLASLLCAHTFADSVFFTNSGTEALECAFKTARRYHYDSGATDRYEIITFEGAFHGRSLACIAATGNESYLEGFGPKALGFIQVPFGDDSALRSAISSKTAAILLEPIQGEGGIRDFPPEALRDIRRLCDDQGILLIYDEVQCGMGRTGRLFSHQWHGDCEPDIMAIAKGIGGGFPLGACLARGDIAKSMVPGTHGSTYGGNPLACSMGIVVMNEILKPDFLESVQLKSSILRQGLSSLLDSYPDLLEEIRGDGLLLGLRCKVPNKEIVDAFRDSHILTAPAGDNVVRLMPPLTIDDDDIREALSRMDSALSSFRSEH